MQFVEGFTFHPQLTQARLKLFTNSSNRHRSLRQQSQSATTPFALLAYSLITFFLRSHNRCHFAAAVPLHRKRTILDSFGPHRHVSFERHRTSIQRRTTLGCPLRLLSSPLLRSNRPLTLILSTLSGISREVYKNAPVVSIASPPTIF